MKRWKNINELKGKELQQCVDDWYCKRLEEKRVVPTIKGKTKADFENEFNCLFQTIGGLRFTGYDVVKQTEAVKKVLKKLCLAFAEWGKNNL